MRPEIVCHMISSLDGRLQIERYSKLHNVENENLALEVYLNLGKQLETDAWIIGRGTVQAMGVTEIYKPKIDLLTKDLTTFVADKSSEKFCVIFDSKGKIHFPDNKLEGDAIIVVLGELVTEDYLNYLRNIGVSYLFAGKDGNDLNLAMNILYTEFGIEKARLEGGGILNGAFLNAGLIDEVSILLYPGIDGLSGISSIFEYKGNKDELPAKKLSFDLKDIQKLEAGLIWLRYDVYHI